MALEQRRLDVVAVLQVTAEVGPLAADQQFGAFLPAEIEVVKDVGRLAAEFQCARDEFVGGGLGNDSAGGGRTGKGDLGDAAAGGCLLYTSRCV